MLSLSSGETDFGVLLLVRLDLLKIDGSEKVNLDALGEVMVVESWSFRDLIEEWRLMLVDPRVRDADRPVDIDRDFAFLRAVFEERRVDEEDVSVAFPFPLSRPEPKRPVILRCRTIEGLSLLSLPRLSLWPGVSVLVKSGVAARIRFVILVTPRWSRDRHLK